MDKVEDIVGLVQNLRFLASKKDGGMNVSRASSSCLIEAADIIQSQQALIEEMREALENVLIDCKSTQELYDRNGPQWTSPTGHEYVDMSYLLGKCEEISEIARKALSQKE